jgi:hypothetical protein
VLIVVCSLVFLLFNSFQDLRFKRYSNSKLFRKKGIMAKTKRYGIKDVLWGSYRSQRVQKSLRRRSKKNVEKF